MYRPVLVLLSMAALLQAGVASPIDSREVSAEAGYLRQTDAYLADPCTYRVTDPLLAKT